MSTVMLSFKQWQKRDANLVSALADFADQQNLSVLIVMLASQTPDFKRELILYCQHKEQYKQLIHHFGVCDLSLTVIDEGQKMTDRGGFVGTYKQGNTRMSRKKLQPHVDAFLKSGLH